jgi:hypothetical protein
VDFLRQEKIAAGVSQGSILVQILNNLYINYALTAPGTDPALFADNTHIYAIE